MFRYFSGHKFCNMNNDTDGGSSDSEVSDLEQNDSPSTDEEEKITEKNRKDNSFDPSLPVKHSYLGNDLEELRGRTVLDDGSFQTIPLMAQSGILLVPGQTLPLTVFYPATISMLRRAIAKDHIFGVISLQHIDSRSPQLADVGTTAEIYEFQEEVERAGFRIKAIGRQRFKLVETRRQIDGNIVARVRILPEILLPEPLSDIRLLSTDRWRKHKNNLQHNTFNKRDAMLTQWPMWVHSQYHTGHLVKRITRCLSFLKMGSKNLVLPTDPVELSFWCAQNLPFLDEQKLSLLRLNSSIQRLRMSLSFLEKYRILCCIQCESKIAYQRDVFSMSVEGPQGTYVNPGGYVHETMTLYKAKGLQLQNAEPSTDFSWFPGYGWTIAECAHCNTHMGWKFTATRKDLKPQTFWGLCRRSLAPKIQAAQQGELTPVL